MPTQAELDGRLWETLGLMFSAANMRRKQMGLLGSNEHAPIKSAEHVKADERIEELRAVLGAICPHLFRYDPVDSSVECNYCGNGAGRSQDIPHWEGCPIADAMAAMRGEEERV